MSALHDFCQVQLKIFEREVANLDHKIRSYFIVIFCWRVNILFFLRLFKQNAFFVYAILFDQNCNHYLDIRKLFASRTNITRFSFFLEKDYSVVSYNRRRCFCGTGAHSPRKNLSNLIFYLHDTINYSDSVKYHSFLYLFFLRTWHGNQQICCRFFDSVFNSQRGICLKLLAKFCRVQWVNVFFN